MNFKPESQIKSSWNLRLKILDKKEISAYSMYFFLFSRKFLKKKAYFINIAGIIIILLGFLSLIHAGSGYHCQKIIKWLCWLFELPDCKSFVESCPENHKQKF